MKVIERRNITSKVDGEYLLQMEDWSEDYPSVHAYADQLAAYPIAKGSVYKGNYSYPRRGEKAMNALEDGTKTLKDFVNTFDTTPNLTRKQICECL